MLLKFNVFHVLLFDGKGKGENVYFFANSGFSSKCIEKLSSYLLCMHSSYIIRSHASVLNALIHTMKHE